MEFCDVWYGWGSSRVKSWVVICIDYIIDVMGMIMLCIFEVGSIEFIVIIWVFVCRSDWGSLEVMDDCNSGRCLSVYGCDRYEVKFDIESDFLFFCNFFFKRMRFNVLLGGFV